MRIECALAALRLGAASTTAGRAVLFGRSLFYLLAVVLLSAIWDIVAAERLPGTLAALLPVGGLAVYIGVTEWITLSIPAIHLRIEDDIRSGAIESHLLRPAAYPLMRIADSCGGLLARQAALGAVGVAALALSGRAAPPVSSWPWMIILGMLGGMVGVLLYALVGMSAFWVRRTIPIYLCVQKMSFLLGGLFAPLTLYPAWLQRVAEASPFAAQLYWPAMTAFAPGPPMLLRALAMETLWIALLGLALALIWRIGLARMLRQGL